MKFRRNIKSVKELELSSKKLMNKKNLKQKNNNKNMLTGIKKTKKAILTERKKYQVLCLRKSPAKGDNDGKKR